MIYRIHSLSTTISHPVEGGGVAVDAAGVGDTDNVVAAQSEVDGGAVVTNDLQRHRVEGSLGRETVTSVWVLRLLLQ